LDRGRDEPTDCVPQWTVAWVCASSG
jgi:hypothetical protein